MNSRFFRDLLVLPLRARLVLASRKDPTVVASIQYQIWRITRHVDDAEPVIGKLVQHDRIRARQIISEIAEITRDCIHLAHLVAIDYSRSWDAEWVREWISRARERGYSNPEILAYLELGLVDPKKEPERAIKAFEMDL